MKRLLRSHQGKGTYKRFQTLPLPSVCNRKGYHWFVVGTVCIGAFMAALDASIINIALPVLKKEFHVRMHIIEWVSLVYLLALAGLIVPLGRIADMMGRRWMYALGFTVFMIGSLVCGMAQTLSFLLISRVIQAIGAAMLQANSVSIITAATPINDRGKAIGIQASAQGIGLSLGPAIGGALLSLANWRWIFLVNVPVGIVGTLLGVLLLPEDAARAKRERFDYLGAALLIPTLVALIYCLNMGYKEGWSSPSVITSYAVFTVGILGFLFVEQRTKWPMVDLALFKNKAFALGSLNGILSFSVMYAVLLLSPFYLDNVQHMSPFQAGLYLTIIPIGMAVFTPISGMIADRHGTKPPTVVGMLIAMIGCISLSLLGETLELVPLLAGLFLVGAGMGIFTPPNNSSVMGSSPSHRLGVAGGIVNMSRTLGMSLGVTLGGLCYQLFLSLSGEVDEFASLVHHMVFAYRWSYLVITVIAASCALLAFAMREKSS